MLARELFAAAGDPLRRRRLVGERRAKAAQERRREPYGRLRQIVFERSQLTLLKAPAEAPYLTESVRLASLHGASHLVPPHVPRATERDDQRG